MATLVDLADMLTTVRNRLKKASSEMSIEVAIDVLNQLLEHTPVDTSQAVSNWMIGLGRKVPSTAFRPPYVMNHWGSGEASKHWAREAAKMILEMKKPGQTIYISNVAPYIVELNFGKSKQEPAFFVERAVYYAQIKAKSKQLDIWKE